MTVSADDRIAGPYVATSGQTSFDGDFQIDDADDITVYRNRSGVVSALASSVYTVSFDSSALPNTFNVILNSGATSGDIYSIFGNTPPVRSSDYTEGGDFFASTVNNSEDRQYWIDQEQARDALRSVRLAPTTATSAFDPTLPAITGNRGLMTNSAGTGWEFGVAPSMLGASGVGVASSVSAAASYNSATGVVTFSIPAGATGASGVSGVAGANGVFAGSEATVSVASADKIALLDATDTFAPKYALGSDFVLAAIHTPLATGYTMSSYSGIGVVASGTVTPDPTVRNIQNYTNAGAHALAPFSAHGTAIVDMTNNASAGAVTTSGFTKTTGDTLTTTNGNKFRYYISVGAGGSHLQKQALQ